MAIELIQALNGDDGSSLSIPSKTRSYAAFSPYPHTQQPCGYRESLRDLIHSPVQSSERRPTIGYHPAGKDSQPSQIEIERLSQATPPYIRNPLFYTILKTTRKNNKQMQDKLKR